MNDSVRISLKPETASTLQKDLNDRVRGLHDSYHAEDILMVALDLADDRGLLEKMKLVATNRNSIGDFVKTLKDLKTQKFVNIWSTDNYSSYAEALHDGACYQAAVPKDTPLETITSIIKAVGDCHSGEEDRYQFEIIE